MKKRKKIKSMCIYEQGHVRMGQSKAVFLAFPIFGDIAAGTFIPLVPKKSYGTELPKSCVFPGILSGRCGKEL